MSRESTSPVTEEWQSAHAPVVAAVDGSDPNHAAVLWAAGEASRAGADLSLVAVADEHHIRHLGRGVSKSRAQRAVDAALEAARTMVGEEHLSGKVLTGLVDETLIGHLDRARLLVVGKRGLHSIPRLLVGSTSLSVAGRCPVPTAVVPESWSQHEHENDVIVVGVEPDQDNARLLHLAFRRADHLGVPLVVIHGHEHSEELPVEDDPVTAAAPGSRLDEELAPWRDRFPAVDVRPLDSRSHPAMAVLDAAETAQLVVLGRHKDSRFSGFGFGSVTRAVLHYATCPVLVVPTDEA